MWIHQNAWFHLGTFDENFAFEYTLNDKLNGVYAFILKGNFNINDQKLNERDGFGVWDVQKLNITAKSQGAEILLMEVPMTI